MRLAIVKHLRSAKFLKATMYRGRPPRAAAPSAAHVALLLTVVAAATLPAAIANVQLTWDDLLYTQDNTLSYLTFRTSKTDKTDST